MTKSTAWLLRIAGFFIGIGTTYLWGWPVLCILVGLLVIALVALPNKNIC